MRGASNLGKKEGFQSVPKNTNGEFRIAQIVKERVPHSVKCIYHAYISHVSRYSLDQKKVSSRSRLGHSRVSSRSRLGQFGKRLGLVSVSGAQVSVLVSVSTQKVLGPSLTNGTSHNTDHSKHSTRAIKRVHSPVVLLV